MTWHQWHLLDMDFFKYWGPILVAHGLFSILKVILLNHF